jgi:hypothetical protein
VVGVREVGARGQRLPVTGAEQPLAVGQRRLAELDRIGQSSGPVEGGSQIPLGPQRLRVPGSAQLLQVDDLALIERNRFLHPAAEAVDRGQVGASANRVARGSPGNSLPLSQRPFQRRGRLVGLPAGEVGDRQVLPGGDGVRVDRADCVL